MSVASVGGRRWRRWRHKEGGPQPIETLPDASNMTPSNAAAESSAPGARDEEEDDEADGAADGTQRNDAKGMGTDTRVEAILCR